MEKLLLNADEASYVLGISKGTLFRLTKAKKISRLQLSDGRVAWAKSEILKFITDCNTKHAG
jgi:predicted DNA-binding transcriptional regulator AlpA